MIPPTDFGQQIINHGERPSNRRVVAEIILVEGVFFVFIALLVIFDNI